MFFAVSKIVFFFARPSNAAILFGLLGCVLLFTRRHRAGRWMVTLSLLTIALAGFSPLGNLVIAPLEERFPAPVKTENIDGIIVLGGSFDLVASEIYQSVEVNESAERLIVIPQLARQYPGVPIVFTGGSGQLVLRSSNSEAEVARALFEALGVDGSRLVLEDKSRNTWENAVLTRDLVEPAAGSRWLLVTSAYHMPRAIGCFRKAGWPGLVAYPVDYRTKGPGAIFVPIGSVSEGLRRLDTAVREWLGLVAYYQTGKTDALFPAPRS